MTIRQFFAQRPCLSAVVALSVAAAGICAVLSVGRSDYPELAPTIVSVSTTYSGASPAVIADTVATPIEDQINSVENVYFFDSRCNDSGTYELFVTFLPGTNHDMNLVKVQNAVKRAEPKLPGEVLQVGLAVEKCSSDYAVQFLFTTDGSEMDIVALGNFVNHEIKDTLQRVRGVSSVSCSNNEYAMRVWLDAMKMDALGVSVSDVRAAISGQNIQPAAGFVGNAMSSPYLSYKVNAAGRLSDAGEFESIVVRTDPTTGARVLLGDVARCELGFKSYTQEARQDGKLCFLASAYADSEANTRDVARACRAAVADWMERAPKGVAYSVFHDQADFIDAMVSNFGVMLAVAGLFPIVVFALFAGLRKAAVAAAIVLVSQLCGFLLLWGAGWTFDAITAFAFFAGIATSLLIASGGAAGVTTSLVIAASSPLAIYGGMTGAMFVRFAAVVSAITASAACLSVLLGVKPVQAAARQVSWRIIARRCAATAVVALLFAVSPLVPKGFVPEEDKGFIKIEVELSEGSSLARTSAVVAKVNEVLSGIPGVEIVYSAAGNSVVTKVGENHAAVSVLLKPWKERRGLSASDICADIEKRLSTISEAKFFAIMPTPVRGMGGTGGCRASLCAIGEVDPAEQSADVEAYAEIFRAMDDVKTVATTFSADTPQLFFDIDRDKAQALGVTVPSVFSTLQSKLAGFYVNDFNIEGCSRQVIVQNGYDGRDALEDALDMRFPGAGGAMVPLSSVGSFRYTLGARVIPRFEKRVAAGVVMRPAEGVSTLELVRRIEQNPPDPKKYLVKYSTMTREEVSSRGKFERMILISVFLMYFVLVAATESWLEPLRLMLSPIPAIAGGIFGIWVCGQDFTVLAQLALVILLALPPCMAVRPRLVAIVAYVAALILAIGFSLFGPDVGAATFRAFAVPMAFGLSVSAAVEALCGADVKKR